MISEKLMEDLKQAMKANDKTKVSVIRMLRSELKNAQIAAGKELDETAEERVLISYAKKRKEAVETYREGGRDDLADKEQLEHDITISYLPPRLGEDELRAVIEKHIEASGALSMKEFGAVMKAVMADVGSKADGSQVSALLKSILSAKN